MSDRDDSDSRLDRLLRTAAPPAPPAGLADRIIGFAAAQPQHKPFAIGDWLRQAWRGVMADWPQGLAYKAAIMLLVAVVTFGGGIQRGFHGGSQRADAEFVDVILGDFTLSL